MSKYDPTECARLAKELRVDHMRMTPAPWEPSVWYGADNGGWAAVGPHHEGEGDCDCDGPGGAAETKAQHDASGIARIRNNAPATSEQLEAAMAEIERLTNERNEALGDGVLSQRVCDIENERAQLRADVDRMRPVIIAATAWRAADLACARDAKSVDVQRAEYELAQAVDAYRAGEP